MRKDPRSILSRQALTALGGLVSPRFKEGRVADVKIMMMNKFAAKILTVDMNPMQECNVIYKNTG